MLPAETVIGRRLAAERKPRWRRNRRSLASFALVESGGEPTVAAATGAPQSLYQRSIDQGCLGCRVHIVLADAVGELDQLEPAVHDVEDAEVGDDPVDDRLAGQRKRTFLQQLALAVLRGVVHDHDYPL